MWRGLTIVGLVGVTSALGCARRPAAPEAPALQAPAERVESDRPHVHEEATEEVGVVRFPVSCTEQAQRHVETGLAHLHHMMYEHARPHFEAARRADASCAMAHWGIAMTSFQPLWHPTREDDLARGKSAVEAARALGAPTARERRYIAAVAAYFDDPEPPALDKPSDHEARLEAWMRAQREVHQAHPDDVDAAAF